MIEDATLIDGVDGQTFEWTDEGHLPAFGLF